MNTDPQVREILEKIPSSSREALGSKRLFFGHQSVGGNILSGVTALSQQGLISLDVVEGRTADALAARPALAHAAIGQNRDPGGKIKDFAGVMRGGLGAHTDIAFFKFCYVDFESNAQVQEVFNAYKTTMAELKAEFPRVTFVHVTTPLTVVQGGPKAIIKSLLGRKPAGVEANIARHQFNERLRQEYSGKAPLFDLAALESTGPGGSLEVFEEGGRKYPKLIEAYSSDGEHLNGNGARWAAARLIEFLATLTRA